MSAAYHRFWMQCLVPHLPTPAHISVDYLFFHLLFVCIFQYKQIILKLGWFLGILQQPTIIKNTSISITLKRNFFITKKISESDKKKSSNLLRYKLDKSNRQSHGITVDPFTPSPLLLIDIRNDTTSPPDFLLGAKQCQYLQVMDINIISTYLHKSHNFHKYLL